MRSTTVAELAQRYGLDASYRAERWESFDAFGASYRAARAVLRTPGDLRRLVEEAVADARADGAVWIEPRTSISSYAHIVGPEEATVELLLDAAALFGLGGDERHPPEPFSAAFAIAADAGLLRVPHAGRAIWS